MSEKKDNHLHLAVTDLAEQLAAAQQKQGFPTRQVELSKQQLILIIGITSLLSAVFTVVLSRIF